MDKYKVLFDGELNIIDESYEPHKQSIEWKIDENGKKYANVNFYDRSIYRKANIKVSIPSNEFSGHNLPHVHVVVDREHTFSVGISKIEILAPKKESRLDKSVLDLTHENIQMFRKEWNEVSSMMKFEKDENDLFTDKLIKVS